MSTNTTSVLRVVPDPVKPRTETEEKLWWALSAHPVSTATALSTAAGIGKSTTPKILSRWEKDGLVTRTVGTVDGGTRPADRWSITTDEQPSNEHPSGDQSADGRPGDDRPAAVDGARADGEVQPGGGRLAPGALRGMVEDYLREHSGEDFSPNAVGKALNRSAGAVHNALEKLVEGGCAVRTSDKPKKYSFAPTDAAVDPGK